MRSRYIFLNTYYFDYKVIFSLHRIERQQKFFFEEKMPPSGKEDSSGSSKCPKSVTEPWRTSKGESTGCEQPEELV